MRVDKVILFADSKVGFEVLKYLKNNYIKDILRVIINKDKNLKNYCLKNNIPFEEFKSEDSIINYIYSQEIDLGILAWWPKIISKKLINSTKCGFINFHNSYLPYNKGKNPYFWTFVEENPYGVTLHKVDEGIDTGEIISQELIQYDWEDNAGSIYEKSLIEIVKLFKKTYPQIKEDGIKSFPQDEEGTFHYESALDFKSEIFLDRKYKARDLLNLIRGRTSSSSFPASFFKDGNKKYRVKISIEKEDL